MSLRRFCYFHIETSWCCHQSSCWRQRLEWRLKVFCHGYSQKVRSWRFHAPPKCCEFLHPCRRTAHQSLPAGQRHKQMIRDQWRRDIKAGLKAFQSFHFSVQLVMFLSLDKKKRRPSKADWLQTITLWCYVKDNPVRCDYGYVREKKISPLSSMTPLNFFLTWQADFSSSGDSYPAQIMEGLRVYHQYSGLLQVSKSIMGRAAWLSFSATLGNRLP